jgi:hypothetical protein
MGIAPRRRTKEATPVLAGGGGHTFRTTWGRRGGAAIVVRPSGQAASGRSGRVGHAPARPSDPVAKYADGETRNEAGAEAGGAAGILLRE